MSEFTELENAFIDGLVAVMVTTNAVVTTEKLANEAMDLNVRQADDLRDEIGTIGPDEFERLLNEAIDRSGFDESDTVVAIMRDGVLMLRAMAEHLDAQGLTRANSDLPVL